MNILFLFQRFSFGSSTIYLDLVKECVAKGHTVYVLAGTSEEVDDSRIQVIEGCNVVFVPLFDQFKAGKIKKGLVQLAIEPIFISKLKRFLWDKKIDIITYPTPPITLAGVVKKAKKHYGAITYLMLKDIFPQNAADLGMMGQGSLIFKYFKRVESRLYECSDFIGCMSEANVEYIKQHSERHLHSRLCVFPNTVKIKDNSLGGVGAMCDDVKEGAKASQCVNFIFGGNLGKPQAVDFLLAGIKALSDYPKAFFTIIGDGTEACLVESFFRDNNVSNAVYKKQLPRDEYEELLKCQDIGIISLSSRFTIPNFPSRLLSYMQMSKPVLVMTDSVSDIGDVVVNRAGCGYFTPSDDVDGFVSTVKKICDDADSLKELGANGHRYLCENYSVEKSVELLEKASRH